jgi:DNA-binding GntR family transcriptional regulator
VNRPVFRRLPDSETRRIVDIVYTALRRAIIRHEVSAGAHLSVPALAEEFGVSRSPVRESVQRLVADGLAMELPRRGAFVKQHDMAELLSLYQVRKVLDGLAARMAAARATPQRIRQINAILQTQRAAIEADDLERHIETDIDFHRELLKWADDSVLIELLGGIYHRIHSAMRARVALTGPRVAFDDHSAILRAVEAGDGDAAEAAAREHVERVIQRFPPPGQQQKPARPARSGAPRSATCSKAMELPAGERG